jgi:hypothetical protein
MFYFNGLKINIGSLCEMNKQIFLININCLNELLSDTSSGEPLA